MIGSGMNSITTVIGFGMSATFIVFVCARLICGRLRRVDSRQMFEIESRIDLEQVHNMFGRVPREGSIANHAPMRPQFPPLLHRCMAKKAVNLSSLPAALTGLLRNKARKTSTTCYAAAC